MGRSPLWMWLGIATHLMPPIRKIIYCTPFRMMRYSVILRSNQIRGTPNKRRLVDEENDVFIKRPSRDPVVGGPVRFRPKPYHLANWAAGRLTRWYGVGAK